GAHRPPIGACVRDLYRAARGPPGVARRAYRARRAPELAGARDARGWLAGARPADVRGAARARSGRRADADRAHEPGGHVVRGSWTGERPNVLLRRARG